MGGLGWRSRLYQLKVVQNMTRIFWIGLVGSSSSEYGWKGSQLEVPLIQWKLSTSHLNWCSWMSLSIVPQQNEANPLLPTIIWHCLIEIWRWHLQFNLVSTDYKIVVSFPKASSWDLGNLEFLRSLGRGCFQDGVLRGSFFFTSCTTPRTSGCMHVPAKSLPIWCCLMVQQAPLCGTVLSALDFGCRIWNG